METLKVLKQCFPLGYCTCSSENEVGLFLLQWYEPRDVRVKVKSSKGNPGSTDLISDRLCDMV